MSATNPRKFSEKIAIQKRKLNEEQSAFDKIIAEVHTITKVPIFLIFLFLSRVAVNLLLLAFFSSKFFSISLGYLFKFLHGCHR
ncbi:unnamed protein product [Soboliphyme baturini]|uniref:TORC_N domain-containing protein n=1 Tax=Soboliphyme baturini TaxID=241478 RepID=A0A183IZ58_9BILA|nr:unnamed protein product [Soboliphyme baturini]